MPADRTCWDDVEVRSADDVPKYATALVGYTSKTKIRMQWIWIPEIYFGICNYLPRIGLT